MYEVQGKQKRCQQHKGGDSSPLLQYHKIAPGVLRSVLGSPAQEGHRALGLSSEDNHEDDQRAEGAPT